MQYSRALVITAALKCHIVMVKTEQSKRKTFGAGLLKQTYTSCVVFGIHQQNIAGSKR